MHSISDEQIDFILNDITKRGVEIEDVKFNILDHVCCIIENEMPSGGNFNEFYKNTIARFYRKELKEIEDEAIELITFKYYYAMKRTLKITGIVSVVLIIIGSILKLQHLPGAGISLVSGFTVFSLFFIPLLIIMKFRDDKEKKNRLVVTLGMILTLSGTIGLLMKVMHWPGANYIFLSSLVLFGLVFIPIYFFSRYKDPDLKFNTTINTVFMIAAAGMLFTMINLKNSKVFEDSKLTMELFQEDNVKVIKESNLRLTDSLAIHFSGTMDISFITCDLEEIIEGIRVNLISESEGISTKAAEHMSIEELHFPNDFKVIDQHFSKDGGDYSHSNLVNAVEQYNQGIQDLGEPDILRPIDVSGLQMTNTTISVVLNQLNDIHMLALSNENSYLSFQKGWLASQED